MGDAGSNPALTAKNKNMRSAVLQRILDKMENDPWYVKIKRWIIIELWTLRCIGIKYFKLKK